MDTISKILLLTAAALALFYSGRWYEYRQNQAIINGVLENVLEVDYIIPWDDPDYAGEIAAGLCLTPEAILPAYKLIQ